MFVSESCVEHHPFVSLQFTHSLLYNLSLLTDAYTFQVIKGETKLFVEVTGMFTCHLCELLQLLMVPPPHMRLVV